MEGISKYNVARKYEKRSLLILVNCVAALSIFFFGYDQGVMGGVNTDRNYAETMKFGHWDESKGLVVVDHSLLQGGIVGRPLPPNVSNLLNVERLQFITSPAHWLVHYSVAGSGTAMVELERLLWPLSGQSLVPPSSARLKTPIGCSAVSLPAPTLSLD